MDPVTRERLFGLQQHLVEAWGRAYGPLRADRLRLEQIQARDMLLRTLIDRVVYGVAIAVVVALIIVGRISLGAFASYLVAIDRFTDAVYWLLWNIAATDGDLRYIRDLLEYLGLPEEPSGARRLSGQQAAPIATPMIQFEPISG